jgi:hypothetical protein
VWQRLWEAKRGVRQGSAAPMEVRPGPSVTPLPWGHSSSYCFSVFLQLDRAAVAQHLSTSLTLGPFCFSRFQHCRAACHCEVARNGRSPCMNVHSPVPAAPLCSPRTTAGLPVHSGGRLVRLWNTAHRADHAADGATTRRLAATPCAGRLLAGEDCRTAAHCSA